MPFMKITGATTAKIRHQLGYGPWGSKLSGVVEVTPNNDAVIEFTVAGFGYPVALQLKGLLYSTAAYKSLTPHTHTFAHTHAAVTGISTGNNTTDHSHTFDTQNLSGQIVNFTSGGDANYLNSYDDFGHSHNATNSFGAQSNNLSGTTGKGTGTFPTVTDTSAKLTYFTNLTVYIFNHVSNLFEDVTTAIKSLSGVATWGGAGTFATSGTGIFDISSLLNVNRIGANGIVRMKFVETTSSTGGRLQYTVG